MNLIKQVEKGIIILCLFTFVTSSCSQPAKNNSEIIADSNQEEITETRCEGNFTYETFHTVLQQLNLTCNEIYLPNVSEQVLPANKSFTIWIIPKIDYLEEGYNDSYCLDRYILLADTKTGKIVSKNHKLKAWTSDAIMLQRPHIDTLDFRLNDERVMFGIRWGYVGSSRVVPYGEYFLELFVQQNDSLVSVFEYMTDKYHGENNGRGSGWLNTSTTELFTTDHKEAGFSDIVLMTEYKLEETQDDGDIKESSSTDSLCFFRYIKDVYQKVDKIEGTICREIKDGYGKRECRYLGKTLEETYQIIYTDNEEDLQQYMLSELPPDNREYEMTAKWNEDEDILTVSYTYSEPDKLVITFCTDYGCGYYIFEQKENHTIFRYDYHD